MKTTTYNKWTIPSFHKRWNMIIILVTSNQIMMKRWIAVDCYWLFDVYNWMETFTKKFQKMLKVNSVQAITLKNMSSVSNRV